MAIILILIRCVYRIDELSDGYSGPLVHDEGLFVGLEGVLIIVAVFCLAVAQPGPVFGWPANEKREVEEAEMAAVTIVKGEGEEKTSFERII